MPVTRSGGLRSAGPLGFALLAAAVLAPSGCGTKPASTVTVVVNSEAIVGTDVDTISGDWERGGNSSEFDTPLDPNRATIPGSLTIYDDPNDDVKPTEPVLFRFRLTAENLGKRARIERAINVGLLEGDPRMVFVTFRYACLNFTEICPPDQTCVAGRCDSALIDVESAPAFDKAKVNPRKGVDPCFDPEEGFGAPMADLPPTALVGSKTQCFLEPPNAPSASGSARKLNVALSWDRDPTRAIPLDNEATLREGWVFEDESSHRIRLAPGYCDLTKPSAGPPDDRPRVTNVRISYAALPKTQSLPLCPAPGGKMGFTISPPGG